MQMCHQLCTLQISDYIFSPLGGQGQRYINKSRNIICQSLMRIYPSDFQNSISKRHRVENCPRAEGEGKRCNGATTVQKLQEMTGLCARANYLESFSICRRRFNLVMEFIGKLLFNLHNQMNICLLVSVLGFYISSNCIHSILLNIDLALYSILLLWEIKFNKSQNTFFCKKSPV